MNRSGFWLVLGKMVAILNKTISKLYFLVQSGRGGLVCLFVSSSHSAEGNNRYTVDQIQAPYGVSIVQKGRPFVTIQIVERRAADLSAVYDTWRRP